MFTENFNEKRKNKRVDFKEPVSFEIDGHNDFGGCLSADLSEDGIRVNFNDFIPLNTRVKIQMHLKNQEVLSFNARVVWVKQLRFSDSYQVGLEFESDGPELYARNRVREYVEK